MNMFALCSNDGRWCHVIHRLVSGWVTGDPERCWVLPAPVLEIAFVTFQSSWINGSTCLAAFKLN